MCGRFGFKIITLKDGTQKWIRLVQEIPNLDVNKIDSLFERLSGSESFPGGRSPILRYMQSAYKFDSGIWGVKPEWSPKQIFNTRTEKLFHSSFWGAFTNHQRCIVPASYFFEWKSEKGTKIRYRIENRNQKDFCFAGIWGEIEKSESKNNKPNITPDIEPNFWFTILTQEGNSLMKEIHNTGGNQGRQPVQISEEHLEAWLDPKLTTESQVLKLIETYSSESIIGMPETDQLSLF